LHEFLSETLPEVPEAALTRFSSDYGLSQDESLVLTAHPSSIQLFDQAAAVALQQLVGQKHVPHDVYKIMANLMCSHLFALVKETDDSNHHGKATTSSATAIDDDHHDDESMMVTNFSKISGQQLGEVVAMILEGRISKTMAKQILTILYHQDDICKSSRQIAVEHGFELIVDPEQLRHLCRDIVAEHPQQVEEYKKGGKYIRRIENFLVGQIMAKTKSNAHPERLLETLQIVLEEVAPGAK
jgi:Asp-tRNA(Asn)/Glu-tRNA(Gln) amidotransferase B subunit